MRKLACLLLLILFTTSGGLLAMTMLQDQNRTRQEADKLFQDHNYAEALQLYRQLALNPETLATRVPTDLSRAVDCLAQLNLWHEFDALFDQVVSAHDQNWRLLAKAGELLNTQVPSEGFLIAGEFHRGHHRGGGQFVTAAARDRVHAIRLLLQAVQLLQDADASGLSQADVYRQLATAVGNIRYQGAWKLQDLTDLETLPDYEVVQGYRWPGPLGEDEGAPVDQDGNPVFHQLPESWQAATTDGERWRWALQQVVQADPSRRSVIDLEWAQFLQSQFGVSAQVVGLTPVIRQSGADTKGNANADADDADDAPQDATPWNAHLLPDSETIARLATGVKRFELPDEFNHILIYQQVIERKDDQLRSALEALVNSRMNRHQYDQAADLLKQILTLATETDDRKQVQQRIDQILNNWVDFESTQVQPAGSGASFEIAYRNGSRVSFTAYPIDIDKLLRDTQDYLRSNPNELDRQKLQIENVGYRLIQENREAYIGPAVKSWDVDLEPPDLHFDALKTVTPEISKPGAYWLVAKIADGNEARIVLWLADTAITRKQAEGGTLYFVADAVSGRPISRANVEFFGWNQESVGEFRERRYVVRTSRFADRTDNDGLVIPSPEQINPEYNWLTIVRTDDGRMAYDGFHGVWNPEKLDELNYSPVKVYTVTDRPVYRPQHTVKFRMWVRQPQFHEENASFAGKSFTLQIRNPRGETVFEREVTTDRWAGVDGEWQIPADATLGQYSLAIGDKIRLVQTRRRGNLSENVEVESLQELGEGSFRVEEYRKPEFKITVDAPQHPVQLGEEIQATISAEYYFGAPVTEATVHYKVERTKKDQRWFPVAPWDWLYSPGYWWFSPDYTWYPGWDRWGCWGPIPPWRGWSPDPPELVAEGDVEIGPDGKYQVRIDTAAALRQHSDSDHQYSITAEVVDQSRRTIIGTGNVIVARDPFKVFVWTNQGHYRTGDTVEVGIQARTPDGKGVQGAGTATLLAVSYPDGSDIPEESPVESWDVATDESGRTNLKLVVPDSGQFRLSVRLTAENQLGGDQADQPAAGQSTQEGGYVFFVRGPSEDGSGYRFNALELITEKKQYQPGETVTLQVNTDQADSTVLLFVRPVDGLVPKPQVLRLQGKSTTFDLQIERRDMPNIFVEALTITNGQLHSTVREIAVPPEQKVANVEVLPAEQRYRPGAKAEVKLKLTDSAGNPFVGNTVLSVYDASLEYIAASAIPEIREFFWNVRRHHYLQNETTLDDVSDSLSLPDEIPMQALHGSVPAMGSGGYGFPSRMGRSRGGADSMLMMSEAAPADAMAFDGSGSNSVRAVATKGIAGGRGGAAGSAQVEPVVRTQFADTAYWVASVTSDQDGIVNVSFDVPDNLTTWNIKAWTLGDGTRVGQGTSSIISTKDLIIRPQTPRFFTETDRITVSAVVHNYLQTAKTATVILETEGGQLQLPENAEQVVQIAANGEARVDWDLQVIASGTTTVRMKALTDEESDAAQLTVPVNVHGLLKTESFTGVIRPEDDSATITVNVPAARIEEPSRLEVRYSPSLAAAMVDALPYLIDYPYGCTEQTLNRFLPAVITQNTLQQMGLDLADIREKHTNLNAQEIGDAAERAAQWKRYLRNPVFDQTQMNVIVKNSVQALSEMQLSDGGWGWFSGYGEHSTAHMTSQVVHGLTIARQNDVAILPDVIKRGVDWLKNYQSAELAELREADWRKEHPDQLDDRHQPYKDHADNLDAFVAFVLTEHDASDPAMSEYLYRDRAQLSVYGMALTGLVLHTQQSVEQRDMVLRNIEQFLETDSENQTAWLRMDTAPWWFWYGSENEAMARYLQLLLQVRPADETAPALVKYLLNNRKHGTYWNSTRDTAVVIEALADYIQVSGEDKPDMTIEVLVDGTLQKRVSVTAETLFSFDPAMVLTGDAVKTGEHTIEIRRTGSGPVYFNAYLTNFTREDPITAAGLEVKVARNFYRLERDDQEVSVQGDRGQVVSQQTVKYRRIPLQNLDQITSGQLVEVELVIDSKNDYEYLMLEDRKPSGFETDYQRSGYVYDSLRAYRELRDDKVTFFLSRLARGQHSISYRLRAELPSQQVSALPAVIEGMYSPELVGNSDEFDLSVSDHE